MISFFVLLVLIVFVGTINASEQKLTRTPTKQSFRIPNTAFNNNNNNYVQTNKSNNKKSSNAIVNNKNKDVNLNKVVNKFLTDFKDEVVDCVDSIVFAQSNSERIDAIIDVSYRHKKKIAVIGAGMVIKRLLFSKKAQDVGLETLKQLRDSESKKWINRPI